MHDGWRLGCPFGIPITIHYSWLFIFALVVWSLASDYLPTHHPGVSGAASWAWAIVAALLFFASVLAHELAHSLVARARGIPVDGITLFALGGISELKRDATGPRIELLVALVGPFTSLALAGVLWLAWRWLLPWSMPAAAVAYYLAYGNTVLGLFNLVPGFPLDGGRALRALVWARTHDLVRATCLAVRTGRVAAALLVGIGAWQAFEGAGASGLWLILSAWFLWSAAELETTRSTIQAALEGRTVESFVNGKIAVLDAEMTIAAAVDQIATASPQSLYPVLAEGRLLGALTPCDIAQFPVERWRSTSVNWLTRRVGPLPTLPLETDAIEALGTLDELQTDALPVEDNDGRLVGTFERAAVLRWIQFHALAGARP
ncbi:MAG TPA: site-2 protease family protein [Candidatus Limnocylindria bacterium]|nr:site-2 protease family protein [Candidatus Limnocylindria bacterium]